MTEEQQTPVDDAQEGEQVEAQSVEPDEGSSDDLAAKIESLEEQLAQAKEQALRAAAEAHNTKRRAEQDVEKAHKFALDKFVSSLLPVADNLERALDAGKAEGAEIGALNEGVELTLKSLQSALSQNSVEAVNPEGEPFNPEFHQAMSMIEQPDIEPNSVINVYQKGYTLNGRLVRPAMVVVSKS